MGEDQGSKSIVKVIYKPISKSLLTRINARKSFVNVSLQMGKNTQENPKSLQMGIKARKSIDCIKMYYESLTKSLQMGNKARKSIDCIKMFYEYNKITKSLFERITTRKRQTNVLL